MDPNATLETALDALVDSHRSDYWRPSVPTWYPTKAQAQEYADSRRATAIEALRDLAEWLEKNGFAPDVRVKEDRTGRTDRRWYQVHAE